METGHPKGGALMRPPLVKERPEGFKDSREVLGFWSEEEGGRGEEGEV